MLTEQINNTGLIEFDGYLIERLISERQIQTAVQRVADEIYRDYHDKRPVFIGVLKGAYPFFADLTRELGRGNPEIGRPSMPLDVDFLKISTYEGEQSTGEVKKSISLSTDISDRIVIVVEDIIDTGRTLEWLTDELQKMKPAQIKNCALLDKHERREVDIAVEYTGFEIPNKFVVGYGLDKDQQFRNLPFIGVVMGPVISFGQTIPQESFSLPLAGQ